MSALDGYLAAKNRVDYLQKSRDEAQTLLDKNKDLVRAADFELATARESLRAARAVLIQELQGAEP